MSCSVLLTSCAALVPREEPATATLTGKIKGPKVPAWAAGRIQPEWWRQYGDESLSADIGTAFAESPDLKQIEARLRQANAKVAAAKFEAWPALNAGYGFRLGRKKEVDFGPYDLKPWTGALALNWELDVFHKLRRARESAEFSRKAECWDLAGARLVLATRIAESRFRIYRFHEEEEALGDAVDAQTEILGILEDREKAGLISATEIHRARAEREKLIRTREDLKRMRLLANVELDTLKGGRERSSESGRLPSLPPVPGRPVCELLNCHPQLLSAEAKLRAAFRLEESARLNLLPSFRLKGNLMGASPHFFLDEFMTWERQIGPSLDIPVFDPGRRAALCLRRAQTDEAAAQFKSTLVSIVGDIDSAYINFQSRKRQYGSVSREVEELAEARRDVTSNFRAGLLSQVEVLESERSYLEAFRNKITIREALINDHIALIRALGGACGDEAGCVSPCITAEPVMISTPVKSLSSVDHP